MHEGSLALAQVEHDGIRMDVGYLKGAIKKTERRIARLERRLEKSEVCVEWKKAYGSKMKLGSDEQLGKVLFDRMGFKSPGKTESGQHKADESSLAKVDHPFIQDYLKVKKLKKALSTNLNGLLALTVDEYLHPTFSLHVTKTYRSSSEAPNFQNQPVRNEMLAELIRRAFVARPGNHLVELDYSGLEVNIAACYHKDPTMLEYLGDETKDMHRDCAMDLYMLEQEEVTKQIRYYGKNGFVFPEFYGDWYIDCARALWEAIDKSHLVTASGTPLREHLASKGIRRLGALVPGEKPVKGTFEYHVCKVERHFWEDRFPVYAQWRKDWFTQYQKKGWFLTKTGFICQGYMKKNEAINYPVQGSAFHCLLWSLTRLVLQELPKKKMKALIVGQIHDSIVADVPPEELDDFLALAQHVMTTLLMSIWDWIIVPLKIEADVSPIGGSWVDKKPYDLSGIAKPRVRKKWKRYEPGTPEWMSYWKAHPEDQEEMVNYTRRIK